MSKLLLGVKKGNNFKKTEEVYIHKDLLTLKEFKDLKKVFGTNDYSYVLKSCFLKFAFNKLNLTDELYAQLRPNNTIWDFMNQQEKIKLSLSAEKHLLNYKKINVLRWHLVVCLNDFDLNETNEFEIIKTIIIETRNLMFKSIKKIEKIKLELAEIEYSLLTKREWNDLKILHGNYRENRLIKKCIELYVSQSLSDGVKDYKTENELETKKQKTKNLHIKLSEYEKEFLKSKNCSDIKIDNIIEYNLKICDNLISKGR